ncbi:hypothetical protein ABEB36_009493 [Hypothenemus hampei]|uniref:Uncharacterized protein n=1 Tax=Hypothenemus hampei TaxID=57062 RepID=A0ABD1EGI9_HYPHA
MTFTSILKTTPIFTNQNSRTWQRSDFTTDMPAEHEINPTISDAGIVGLARIGKV